jgi:GAF domain-containing protein
MTLRGIFMRLGGSPAAQLAAANNSAVELGLTRYVEQVARAFDAPIALVSLLHDDTQIILASLGLPFRCLPRQDGFCRYTVDRRSLFEVCDAAANPRFAQLPSVTGDPGVRYYLGAPVVLFGSTSIGALCVVDVKPRRSASLDERAYLAAISRQVGQQLERRLGVEGDLAA